MIRNRLCLFLLLIPTGVYAEMVDVYLSGGAAFSSLTNETTVTINPSLTNNYVTNTQSLTGPYAGLGIGHTFDNCYESPISIMIALTTGYYVGFQQIEGVEYPMINDSVFDTLNYQFKAESFVTMAESRIFFAKYGVRPFLLLGVGASWNHLFDYSETPTDPNATAVPIPIQFKNNVNTSFAYEVGAGIQFLLAKDIQRAVSWYAAVEYRYASMGKGEFTVFPALTSDDTLQIQNMNMQAALLTLQVSFL